MSLGNWGQNLLKDAVGEFFGSDYLRDYTHASKVFRTNSYANAPKLKFLFHTYFEINPDAYFAENNYGILVKEVKLPSFTFTTHQMNQYNRKRIVQTKIKYDPVEISFHDDNNNTINRMWEAYYTYYYNDGSKPQAVLGAGRGSDTPNGDPGYSGNPLTEYNDRNIYNASITGDDDWGFLGGQTDSSGKKVPFFKNITVYGFNQHHFIAYTLVNPIITNFTHDTYKYDEGGGVMQNRMTIDYETVVYHEGDVDGNDPGSMVPGFGDQATYDRTLSPIATLGSNATILGQGGLVNAAGGVLQALKSGNILGAIKTAGTTYNTFKNTNLASIAGTELNTMLHNSITNTPNTRNTLFNFPGSSQTPGPYGTANSPTIGANSLPPIVESNTNLTFGAAPPRVAGGQVNQSIGKTTGFPIEAPFGGNFNTNLGKPPRYT
jgi:hypothetical protein